MDALNLVATVILITASGALAPGPLFFATISHGARSGARSGLAFSITHTLVEFTLVMLLAGGLLTVANEPVVKLTIGVAGGIVLLIFGAMQIRDSLRSKFSEIRHKEPATRSLLLIGLALTGLNPFFIIWWMTAGAELILLSLEFASLAGVVFMYVCHVWLDIVWLTLISHFAKKGMNVIGTKWYRVMIVAFGAILISFGLYFIIDSLYLLLNAALMSSA